MLSKHSQLLELLEIPQVMDNCIRCKCYDEALKLYLDVNRSHCKYPSIGLLQSLAEETEKMKQLLTEQLLKDLRGNSQLPDCLRIVSLLRKLHVFTETEIRIKFLTVSQCTSCRRSERTAGAGVNRTLTSQQPLLSPLSSPLLLFSFLSSPLLNL